MPHVKGGAEALMCEAVTHEPAAVPPPFLCGGGGSKYAQRYVKQW